MLSALMRKMSNTRRKKKKVEVLSYSFFNKKKINTRSILSYLRYPTILEPN